MEMNERRYRRTIRLHLHRNPLCLRFRWRSHDAYLIRARWKCQYEGRRCRRWQRHGPAALGLNRGHGSPRSGIDDDLTCWRRPTEHREPDDGGDDHHGYDTTEDAQSTAIARYLGNDRASLANNYL